MATALMAVAFSHDRVTHASLDFGGVLAFQTSVQHAPGETFSHPKETRARAVTGAVRPAILRNSRKHTCHVHVSLPFELGLIDHDGYDLAQHLAVSFHQAILPWGLRGRDMRLDAHLPEHFAKVFEKLASLVMDDLLWHSGP